MKKDSHFEYRSFFIRRSFILRDRLDNAAMETSGKSTEKISDYSVKGKGSIISDRL